MTSFLKKALPWIGTAIILGYMGMTTDIDRFIASLAYVDIWAFVAVTLVGAVIVFLSDSYCLSVLFRRFFRPVGLADILAVKGTSYFLNVVNYNAGAGGVALFMSKRFGFGFVECIGAMIFLNAMDLFGLSLLLSAGLFLGSELLPTAYQQAMLWILIGMGGVFIGTLLFWVWKVPFLPKAIRKFRIFHGFRVARLSDYFILITIRTVFVAHYVVLHWCYVHLFSLDVPLTPLLIYIPMLTFITVLPISIAGLGTTQVALRYFIAPYPAMAAVAPMLAGLFALSQQSVSAPSGLLEQAGELMLSQGANPMPAIDAYSTSGILGLLSARLLIGFFSIRSVSRDFLEPSKVGPTPSE
jgi:hypothetical protein